MSNLRNLLAAERKARQISHPYASYDRSGRLRCTACDLSIPAEKLWEPHLRSANHKQNVLARDEGAPVSKKRKIEEEDAAEKDNDSNSSRSKNGDEKRMGKRNKLVRFAIDEEVSEELSGRPDGPENEEQAPSPNQVAPERHPEVETIVPRAQDADTISSRHQHTAQFVTQAPADPVDEEEWAAFERDLASLTNPQVSQPSSSGRDDRYASATISAPAISAADLAKNTSSQQPESQQEGARGKRRDYEAEAREEREEEEARMAEELAVMEEMEEKVRRLREMREKLRMRPSQQESVTSHSTPGVIIISTDENEVVQGDVDADDDDEEGDEIDEWFS